MNTEQAEIAVLGRGLTGLAAGLVLARAGYQPLLIGPPPDHLAGGLQLAGNGLAALGQLDQPLADRLLAGSVQLEDIIIKQMGDGTELGSIAHEDRLYAGVSRAGLYQLLLDACKDTGQIRFADRHITHIAPFQDQVRLLAEDGQIIQAGQLLAVDGATGIGRRFVAPQITLRKADHVALRASLPRSRLPAAFASPSTRLYLGAAAHLVCYPYGRGDEINLVLATRLPPDQDPAAAARAVLQACPALDWLADAGAKWVASSLYHADILSCWRRGAVVLAGEAAHVMPPHLAQGFGQSLMDMAALAGALAHHELPAALSQMASQRAAAAAKVASKADQAGAIMRMDGKAAIWRDRIVGLAGGSLINSFLADVWQPDSQTS